MTKNDEINNPSHYTYGGLETIDILEKKLSPMEFKGFLKGNVIKYIVRGALKKDELGDLKKALWYLDRMIKVVQNRA
tara:strand:- start:113 stop:343 length:231 start_codon:yes stop_codon:yes gene_type:complete